MSNADCLPHSLASRLLTACATSGIDVDNDLRFSCFGSAPVSILELSPQDAGRALQAICRHACYARAINAPRKDFCKPCGVFDHQLSTLYLARSPANTPGELPLKARFESVVVGRTLTNDRMAATGWAKSSECRFCRSTKESMLHLTADCQVLREEIGAPSGHQLGVNFQMLGHVEHPKFVGRRRLLHQSSDGLVAADHFADAPLQSRWTDGSVVNSENFWLSVGTFAIIDEAGRTVDTGMVSHWAMCSYVTELWAIFQAFFTAAKPTVVYSDCQSAVTQVASFLTTGVINVQWRCQAWWRSFAHLVRARRAVHPDPFTICWIPAHVLESVPDTLLTEEQAAAFGATVRHNRLNRIADRVAKHLAHRLSPVHQSVQQQARQAIYRHQYWFTMLHAMLPTAALNHAVTTLMT